MPSKKLFLPLVALVLLLAGTLACSVFDEESEGTQAGAATILVYGTDAPGDVTSLNVEMVDVRVFESVDDATGVLLTPDGGSSMVDLVEANNTGTPGLFGSFSIPAGTYQCASGTISIVDFTFMDDNDQPVMCTSASNLPDSITTDKLCLPRPVVVGEGGQTDVVFDLPVISASQDPDTMECQLFFDVGGRRIARLADMM